MIKLIVFLRTLSYFFLILILAACAAKKNINLNGAVPRDEFPSPYGNPANYKALGESYSVLSNSKGYKERGIASWYGPDFHSKRTSSGTPYDMHAYSAAHKSLPIPTYVKVTNLENQKTLILRVDDRGPFKPNRIIDLSYTAAKELGVIAKGTAQVEVEAIEPFQSLNRPRVAPSPATIAAAPIYTSDKYTVSSSNVTAQSSNNSVQTSQNSQVLTSNITDNSNINNAPNIINPNIANSSPNSQFNPQLNPSEVEISTEPNPSSTPQTSYATPQDLASSSHKYFLQLGAFSTMNNAQNLANKIKISAKTDIKIKQDQQMYKVIAGPYSNDLQTQQMRNTFSALGIESARIIAR